MQTITSIAPDPRRQGRFLVAVDGKPRATLSVEAIDRLRLAQGKALDQPLELEIARETMVLDVFDRALDMLALTARSSKDLRQRLVRKGASPEIVDLAIERLQHAGYLDDASFARQFARSKALGSGLSRRRLVQELSRKGVSRELSSEAVDSVFEDEHIDEAENIERVARKKFRSLAKLEPRVRARRLFAFLARRGYDVDEITRVVSALDASADIDVE
jgi:regulatory protein